MAITSSAPNGIQITTSAKNGTVKSFTGGQVRFEEDISISNNGNLMASPIYTGRLIHIDGGTGSGQVRLITAQQTGQGDGGDVDIDVFPPWTTDPDGTSTYQITYIIEDVGTVTGAASAPRTQTGVWEGYGRELYVGSGGGTYASFFTPGEVAFEYRDDGAGNDLVVRDGGRYYTGFNLGDTGLAGGLNFGINNSDNELLMVLEAGSVTDFNDTQWWCLVANLTIQVDGGTHVWRRCKMFGCIYLSYMGGTMTLIDHVFEGKGTTNDTVRLVSGVDIQSCVLTNSDGFISNDDGLTETITVRNCIFVRTVARNVRVNDDKTWNFVNPVNWVADGTAISFEVDDLNEVNKLFSLDITVTEPDGTAINDADCYVYEGLLNQDLPTANRVDTDASGEASTDVLVENYTFPSSVFTTATSGQHALKVYEWLKTPFVTALTPDFEVTGGLSVGVTLIDDPNIVQTTQATAITNGSGITIERPANPTQLLSYDTGTIAFVVGDVVDGAGGAQGTVTEISEGTTSAGRIHLRLRNGTAFVAGEDLDVSAVKKAQATNPLVALDYSTHIDADAKSLQAAYDYIAARQAEDAISADGVTFIEWGEGEHAQIMFADGGDAFRTERNVGATDGVFISDRGTGAVTYLTSDNGTQYTPPTSVTISITVKDAGGSPIQDAIVYVQLVAGPFNDDDEIMRELTNASGLATEPYNYVSDQAVTVRVRKLGFIEKLSNQTIAAGGLTLEVGLDPNPNAE